VKTNRSVLTRGEKIGLKLLSIEEFEKIIKKSRFKNSYSIEETPIAGHPAFIQIILEKER
jgi:hypothetical protein